jgi:hypothetical protein
VSANGKKSNCLKNLNKSKKKEKKQQQEKTNNQE